MTTGIEGLRQLRGALSAYLTQIWIVLLVLFTGLFIFRQQGEIVQFGQTVSGADPRWIAVVALIQCGILGLFAQTYCVLLRRLGHGLGRLRLAEIHLRRHVVGTVTPVGGPASIYAFVRSLGAHGISSSDALLTAALRSMAGYASFVVLFVPIVLLSGPAWPLVLGVSIVAILFFVMVGMVVLLLQSNELPQWFQQRSPERVTSFVEQVREHGIGLKDLSRPVLLSLAANIAGVATMYVALLAVGYQASPVTVLFAYATGMLMLTIAPVFQGIGIVEVTMAASLQHMGVPVTSAIAATLLFRFFDVWFPLGLGLAVHVANSPMIRRAVPQRRASLLTLLNADTSSWRAMGPRVAAVVFCAAVPAFFFFATGQSLPFL